jgi:hypothetical protein
MLTWRGDYKARRHSERDASTQEASHRGHSVVGAEHRGHARRSSVGAERLCGGRGMCQRSIHFAGREARWLPRPLGWVRQHLGQAFS